MRMFKIVMSVMAICFATLSFAQYNKDYADINDSQVVKSLKEEVNYIASKQMKGRKAGSKAEELTAEYVYNKLSSYGVDMLTPKDGDIFGISSVKGDTLVSRNVYGYIQGYDKALNDKYIVIGARLDNLGVNNLIVDGKSVEQIYYGANGNASGIAMMLELAKMISTNALLFRRSIVFVGFGASQEGFAGAWAFVNKQFKDKIDAMINLDMLGGGADKFSAYTFGNTDLINLVNQVSRGVQPVVPHLVKELNYQSSNIVFYNNSIPSIYFSTGNFKEYNTPYDVPELLNYTDMEQELEYIYNFTLALANLENAPKFVKESIEGNEDKIYPYYKCDTKPSFLGHSDPKWFLEKWVYQYLKYPTEALNNGVQGRVVVYFEINTQGKVVNAKIVKGVSNALDAQALKVVEASPKWKPGVVNGKKVRSFMELTIEFRLKKK